MMDPDQIALWYLSITMVTGLALRVRAVASSRRAYAGTGPHGRTHRGVALRCAVITVPILCFAH
jgi:hypothetical protein